MKKIKDLFSINIIGLFFCFTFLAFFILRPIQAASVLEINEDDFVLGDKNAPITIIEYASLSCIHCKDFHENKLPEIIENYVDTNKVKIVFRDFPLNYPALIGSMLLKCIDKKIRYDYLSAFFILQSQWVKADFEIAKKELFKIVQTGGMTKSQFNECIANKDLEGKILQGLMDAQNEFNIGTTPSFLINGTLLEGSRPFKDFKKIIENILSNNE